MIVNHICREFKVSERRAGKVIDQPRTTQRYLSHTSEDEEQLIARVIGLATHNGRYGYRRITAMLEYYGWKVNHKRVERIWKMEGLKVPQKQPKRRRLWLHDGSCIRLRPEHKNHVWSYDFVMDRTSNGQAFRLLTIMDEYTRGCLSIVVKRKLRSQDVLDELYNLFLLRGTPEYI